MRILLLTRYSRLGASSRLRALQYLPRLEAAGLRVDHSELFSDAYLKRLYLTGSRSITVVLIAYVRRIYRLLTASTYDVIWLEKELLPFFPPWLESYIAKLGIPIVTDYDDAIFHTYDMSSSRVIRKYFGKKIDRVMQLSTSVITGNSYLATRAVSSGCLNVHIIPTAVDISRYEPRTHQYRPKKVVVGWIGTPSTAQYVCTILPALERAAQKDTRIELITIGDFTIRSTTMPVTHLPWSEATEAHDLLSFDIGIMPLHDTPWERGKCAYKLIQYMAAGLPVVASPIGANTDVVLENLTGLFATSNDDWTDAILSLAADDDRRKAMGAEGRKRVGERYNLDVTAPRLIDVIRLSAGIR